MRKIKSSDLKIFMFFFLIICMGGCENNTTSLQVAAPITAINTPDTFTTSPVQAVQLHFPDLNDTILKEIILTETESKQVVGGGSLGAKYYASIKDVTTTTTMVQDAMKKAGFLRFGASGNSQFFFFSCVEKDNLPDLYYTVLDYGSLPAAYTRTTTPPHTPTVQEKIDKQMIGYKTEVIFNFLPTTNCEALDEPSTPSITPVPYPMTVVRPTKGSNSSTTVHP